MSFIFEKLGPCGKEGLSFSYIEKEKKGMQHC